MKKSELVKRIVEKRNLSIRETNFIINDILEGIMFAIQEEEGKISFPGFGTFKRMKRAPRTYRNPSNGELIEVGEKNFVKFKPGKRFKEIVE